MRFLLRRPVRRYVSRLPTGSVYCPGVEVLQIGPGLWRWTGYHEEWQEDVGCVFCETTDGVVLIDPLVPPEDADRFWRALDRDIRRLEAPVHVLVNIFWHTRSTAEMVERYSARVWATIRGRAAVARRAGVVPDSFRPGDPLPGGMEAFRSGRGSEVLYWLPQHRALVPGDVLLGDGGGGVRMCPESWLPDGIGHAELAMALRSLLDLPVERVLLSHGEPVLVDAKRALTAALAT
jgi:glyoxylase-like metal-dependent hydrolase (beta-lactamase superfamily II)